MSKVAILKTSPATVLEDYHRLMNLAGYQQTLNKAIDTALKINISWHFFYPGSSTTPWQLDGVIKAMLKDGFDPALIHGCHNRTVVIDAYLGERENKQINVIQAHGLRNIHLYEPDNEWVHVRDAVGALADDFLVLNDVFPDGFHIPKRFIGENILHLPTVKCVHPDTELVLADGSLERAGALVEAQLSRGAIPLLDKEGDVHMRARADMLSLNAQGVTGSQQTSHFWRTPTAGQKVWRLRTRTGREVTTSAIHPFLTPKGWRKAESLEVGARIAIPRKLDIQGSPQPLPPLEGLSAPVDIDALPLRAGRKYSVDFQRDAIARYLDGQTQEAIAEALGVKWQIIQSILNRYGVASRMRHKAIKTPEHTSVGFWRWMGYFFAEGWVQPLKGSCRFWWTNTHPALKQDFVALTEDLFGLTPTWRKDESTCYFDSLNLQGWFEAIGLPTPLDSGNKRVPAALFRGTEAEIAAFVGGYIDGDGGVGKLDGLHAVTRSPRLALDLQHLISRLGAVAFRGEKRSRATNSKAPASLYSTLSVYGDDLEILARTVELRMPEKQARLDALVERRARGKRPSNWDTTPIDPEAFRQVRQGLGFTQQSTGKPSSVNSIENGHTTPTRHVARYFIDLFRGADGDGRYAKAIDEMDFMASDTLAWDHVVEIEAVEADTPYLYDFTMEGAPNFIGNGLFLHNTHIFTTTTGAMKNAFGGLLNEHRHWTHPVIHETLVDLLMIQKKIHPGIFAVMDGTFTGDGPGPRCMIPHVKNVLLASSDQVAIDAVAGKLMGFDPLEDLKFIRLAHERGLGCGDIKDIEIVGDLDALGEKWDFVGPFKKMTFASQMQHKIYWGPLKGPLEWSLKTVLAPWSYMASVAYHDVFWYPFKAKQQMEKVLGSEWGRLFRDWENTRADERGFPQIAANPAELERTGAKALAKSFEILATCFKEAPEFAASRRRAAHQRASRG